MSMDSKEIYESLLRGMESAKLGLHPTRFKIVKDGRVRVGSKAKYGSFPIDNSFLEKIEGDPAYLSMHFSYLMHRCYLEFESPDTIYVVNPELLDNSDREHLDGFSLFFRFIFTDSKPLTLTEE